MVSPSQRLRDDAVVYRQKAMVARDAAVKAEQLRKEKLAESDKLEAMAKQSDAAAHKLDFGD
ncbi:hypothetical protein [Rhizobium sp. Leaf386]|uniref:hypothetical protein n=1 Tax=Rhizobium sp. Leaf386 TaxID=1736359 RepID=UPI000714B260|nr:hypothetical protein [Rhizobium sp. Leaf386]KQS95378.1 hypothetical protein ASG50_25475 [Rhizobium sp. Leaf386]